MQTQMPLQQNNEPDHQSIGILMGITTSTIVYALSMWFVLDSKVFWITLTITFCSQLIAWFGWKFLIEKIDHAHKKDQ